MKIAKKDIELLAIEELDDELANDDLTDIQQAETLADFWNK